MSEEKSNDNQKQKKKVVKPTITVTKKPKKKPIMEVETEKVKVLCGIADENGYFDENLMDTETETWHRDEKHGDEIYNPENENDLCIEDLIEIENIDIMYQNEMQNDANAKEMDEYTPQLQFIE